MMDLSELASKIYKDFETTPRQFSGMYYGDNGSGKTKLALETAVVLTPPDKKVLFVDTSSGWETINNHPELADKLRGRLSILPYDGEDQLNTLANALIANQGNFSSTFGTVIVDESTAMAQNYLDVVTDYRASKDKAKEADKPDWPDFNIAGNKWRKTCTLFLRARGVHVIHVGHFRSDKVQGVQKVSPSFQPAVGNDIQREWKLIAWCEVKSDGDKFERTVRVHGDQFVTAKCRIQYKGSELPPVVTHNTVLNAIREKYGVAE